MIQTQVLKQHLNTDWLGSHLVELDKIDSTNNYAKAHASELRHGSVILAHEQLKGRGQAQKYWHSTALQNIHISIYLKPTREEGLHLLTFIPALSILTLLKNLGFTGLAIKWPNDLYVYDKKLSGVLTENTYQGGRFQSTILGVGWNVNEEHFPSELTESATSLIQELQSEQHSLDRDQLQKYLDRSPKLMDTSPTSIVGDGSSVKEDSQTRNKWSKTQLLIDFLAHFEQYYSLWENEPKSLAKQVNQHLIGYGKQVLLLRLDQPNTHAESVKCLGLDESGGLRVLDKEMEVNTFTYEQIRIKPE
ncbi:MAG: biotin--[acetyl-CoA-carboxylase] ligase [Bacteroidetes bacterium]|nr:biotin--[acetyl-CoA-carboxylase] ligase [Bacteroidota bacterium]